MGSHEKIDCIASSKPHSVSIHTFPPISHDGAVSGSRPRQRRQGAPAAPAAALAPHPQLHGLARPQGLRMFCPSLASRFLLAHTLIKLVIDHKTLPASPPSLTLCRALVVPTQELPPSYAYARGFVLRRRESYFSSMRMARPDTTVCARCPFRQRGCCDM